MERWNLEPEPVTAHAPRVLRSDARLSLCLAPRPGRHPSRAQ
ncbi:MAG: hypothetical protein ACYC0H_10505 [Solirubrobacteraceae bacterium]